MKTFELRINIDRSILLALKEEIDELIDTP